MRVGDVIHGRYRLEALLGSGSHGVVYEAVALDDGTPVAVKALRPWLAREGAVRTRFEREAAAASRIRHPNVIATLDAGVDPTSCEPFLVQPLLRGLDLKAALLREKRFAPKVAVDLMVPVMAGLIALHREGIVGLAPTALAEDYERAAPRRRWGRVAAAALVAAASFAVAYGASARREPWEVRITTRPASAAVTWDGARTAGGAYVASGSASHAASASRSRSSTTSPMRSGPSVSRRRSTSARSASASGRPSRRANMCSTGPMPFSMPASVRRLPNLVPPMMVTARSTASGDMLLSRASIMVATSG